MRKVEYRKLPHGTEQIGTLGIGTGGLVNASDEEIEYAISKAIDNGINFFDLCAWASNVFAPFGRAIKGRRNEIYFQLHFGAVYRNSQYGWSRDLDQIKQTFAWEMQQLGTDHVDFGFLHCVDESEDWEEIVSGGILQYVQELKEQGVVKHIGFSSHTPSVCNRILDTGIADMMMFSLNPAYDLECGDEYGIGTTLERARLLRRCETMGVGVSVMKPFHGGQLLDETTSPFRKKLTTTQCLQYCLDRPAVLVALPGIRNVTDLDLLLTFLDATPEQRDYSVIGEFTPQTAVGNCVYCNHCQPCPAHIDVGLVNKYYDLALAGDNIASDHYDKLKVKASACVQCGRCEKRCPFKVKQMDKMAQISRYFGK